MTDISELYLGDENFVPSKGQKAIPTYIDKYNDLYHRVSRALQDQLGPRDQQAPKELLVPQARRAQLDRKAFRALPAQQDQLDPSDQRGQIVL